MLLHRRRLISARQRVDIGRDVMRADPPKLAETAFVEPGEEAAAATAYSAHVFGLRMFAVKKSMNRCTARSPAAAIIAGTSITPAAGSIMASSVVFCSSLLGVPASTISTPHSVARVLTDLTLTSYMAERSRHFGVKMHASFVKCACQVSIGSEVSPWIGVQY